MVANLHLRTQYGRVNFAKGSFSESPQAQKKACSNADHVVLLIYAGIFCALHFYSSALFDEEMNDPNCQQNVTCIHLHIQRKKHALYTDSAWRNTCKVRKAILQLSKSKYVDINICTYMCFIFSQYLQKPRHLNHSFLSHVYFPPPISFYPSIFWLQKNFPFQPTNPEKKIHLQSSYIHLTTSSHTKNITKNDETTCVPPYRASILRRFQPTKMPLIQEATAIIATWGRLQLNGHMSHIY